MKQRSISSCGRLMLGVLFLAFCMSFVDDELFLKATNEGGSSNTGTVVLKKNSSWTADATSLFNDWTTDTSSALIDWTNNTSRTASSLLSNWTNGTSTSVSSMLKKSTDWSSSWSNTSVSSVLNDWGVNTSSWDDWEDWFPSTSNSSMSNSSSTSDDDYSWSDWGRFFGGNTEASKTSANKNNKTSLLSWSTPKVSIVIDFRQETENHESDQWMSRMAFAKMLQLEAHAAHGVDAELVVVGTTAAPLTSWSTCFPGIDSEIKLVADVKEFDLKEMEQEQWLGEMAVLLEASPDVWQDGLYLLQQHYRAKAARYASDISLPFLRVSNSSSAPALSEWKHMEALAEFMRIDPSCCTLPRIKVSEDTEKETIVNLQSSYSSAPSVIQPIQLLQLLDRPKGSRIVLVENEPDGSVDAYATMLQDKKGYVVQSIHGAFSAGSSMEARYCLLQQAQHELIGSLDSPSSVWASMTTPNTGDSSPIIRLVGEDKNEVIRQQQMQFSTKDPRSRIRIEDLPPYLPANMSLSTKVALVGDISPVKDVSEKRPGDVSKSVANEDKKAQEGEPIISDSNSLGSPSRPITIVIHLTGEMANHLGKLAFGYSLKWLLQEDYNITAKTVLRHQARRQKWTRAMKSVKSCFTNIKPLNFAGANTPEYDTRHQQQQELFQNKFDGWCEDEKCIRDTIDEYIDAMSNARNLPLNVPNNATITLPFIESTVFGNFGYINDRYIERLKNLFQFDYGNPRCCSERPAPNETLFHFRGFLTEMPKKGVEYGFEELSPNKTVTELLGEHNAGDKVSVLSRFPSKVQPYVDAMKAAGLDARSIVTSNGEQSFCFLLAGQREIIGSSQSTYAIWAAYLGNASKAQLYSLKSPSKVKREGKGYFKYYNYTNPILREKMSLQSFNSEQQDEVERDHRQLLRQNEARR